MNELTLSTDLKQIELEIQHHKQVAGQSIWEIGRRLNHVKEHDLVHGEFMDWYLSMGIDKDFASKSMNIAKKLPNFETLRNLGATALNLIATLPDEEKQEQLQKVEQGDSPTVKELREIKRQLKQKDEQIKQKDNEILELKNQPKPQPIIKTVEIEKEVIPSDYEQLKSANERLKRLQEEHEQLLAERQEHEEKSVKYDQLTQSIQEMEGKMNRTQKLIATQKQVYELVDLSKDLLTKITPIPYLVDAEFVRENEVAKRELMNIADQTNKFLNNLNEILKENRIIEGVIINE
ncbi:DUF3102 domain-containing protein [Facklamia languida]